MNIRYWLCELSSPPFYSCWISRAITKNWTIKCIRTWFTSVTHSVFYVKMDFSLVLQWRHNDHDGVSNHQPHGCLLNRLFGRRSKITSKLRVTGLCAWNSPGPMNSPHKGPVTRKMFPFDDVIMESSSPLSGNSERVQILCSIWGLLWLHWASFVRISISCDLYAHFVGKFHCKIF